MDIATKTCGRCGGTGRYSFNLIDGDRCYGCGGAGVVPTTPKGQKPIKPTAELANAQPGDIIKHGKVLYQVEKITWIKLTWSGFDCFNQKVRAIRLVDGKAFKLWRCANEEKTTGGVSMSTHTDGTKTYNLMSSAIEPTDDMIGQETTETGRRLSDAERTEAINAACDRQGWPRPA